MLNIFDISSRFTAFLVNFVMSKQPIVSRVENTQIVKNSDTMPCPHALDTLKGICVRQ